MSRIDSLLDTLRQQSSAAATAVEGCDSAEIAKIESLAGGALPASYRRFLEVAGKKAGVALAGVDCTFPDLLELREGAEELLEESETDYTLPAEVFVFSMHQGYEFLAFDRSAGHDPAVLQYVEGEDAPTAEWSSFTDYLAEVLTQAGAVLSSSPATTSSSGPRPVGVRNERFAQGDVYIDYPFEDARFRFDHATKTAYRKWHGQSHETRVPNDNRLYTEAIRSGSEITREDYESAGGAARADADEEPSPAGSAEEETRALVYGLFGFDPKTGPAGGDDAIDAELAKRFQAARAVAKTVGAGGRPDADAFRAPELNPKQRAYVDQIAAKLAPELGSSDAEKTEYLTQVLGRVSEWLDGDADAGRALDEWVSKLEALAPESEPHRETKQARASRLRRDAGASIRLNLPTQRPLSAPKPTEET